MVEQVTTIEEYSLDFPELTRPPASNYANTLVFDGHSPLAAGIILMIADVQVKKLVEAAARNPFRAPEQVSHELVAMTFEGYEVGEKADLELVAYVNKATKILRGEMKQNPLWNFAESDEEPL